MPKALLHLDPRTKELLGVWLNVRGTPTCYYEGSQTAQYKGQSTLEARNPDIAWDTYCERLQERTPASIWWETVDAVAKETPQQTFNRVKAASV